MLILLASTCYSLSMSATSAPFKPIVVVGVAGGVAETIAIKLLDMGASDICSIFDRPPYSPMLINALKSNRIKVCINNNNNNNKDDKALYYLKSNGDTESVSISTVIKGSKDIIAVDDDGDDSIRNEIRDRNYIKQTPVILEQLLKSIDPSVNSITCITNTDSNSIKGIEKLFQKSNNFADATKSWCAENKKTFSSLKYGSLLGGVPGLEPLPFVGLPLLEPELHPSYTLTSVVLTNPDSNQYASSEICTRDMLAEATTRHIMNNNKKVNPINTLVISIEGSAPTDKEWNNLFSRISSGNQAQVLNIQFASIVKKSAFITWLVDVWFPQALIEADTATILRGARPVRASKIDESTVKIAWEDIKSDLSVETVGNLLIILDGGSTSQPSLIVTRSTTASNTSKSLPGEMLLMDKLVEGINKYIYAKGIATPI